MVEMVSPERTDRKVNPGILEMLSKESRENEENKETKESVVEKVLLDKTETQ